MNLLVVPMASSLRCFEPGAVMLRTRLELNAYGGGRIRLAHEQLGTLECEPPRTGRREPRIPGD